MGGRRLWDPRDHVQGGGGLGRGVRPGHSQALQLPQTQEGARLHCADDVVPQVPVGSKRGPHTSPAPGPRGSPGRAASPPPLLGSLFPSKSLLASARLGGRMKDLASQTGPPPPPWLPGQTPREIRGRASDEREGARGSATSGWAPAGHRLDRRWQLAPRRHRAKGHPPGGTNCREVFRVASVPGSGGSNSTTRSDQSATLPPLCHILPGAAGAGRRDSPGPLGTGRCPHGPSPPPDPAALWDH